MDHDDDDGVGYIADSHLLRPSPVKQQAMALLKLPREERERSLSSSVSDLDLPIYSTDNLTTRSIGIIEQPDSDLSKDQLAKKATELNQSRINQATEQRFSARLVFAIAAAALGSSFQHGYNTGVVNAPQKLIEEWINTTVSNRTGSVPMQSNVTFIWAIAVSIFCIGGMIGGALVGVVADRFGRKGSLLMNNVLVLVATIMEGFAKMAHSYEMLIVGRFVIGVNSGLNAGLSPMYLAEISPVNLRGAVGTVYQLVITISILISQILGLEVLLGKEKTWPLLLAITIIPAIFQVLTLPFCPESPKYLMLTKGKDAEAEKALAWLRNNADVSEEMEEMKAESEAMKLVPKVTARELCTNRVLRIPLIICLFIMVAQQLSGINAVMFYSTKIFKIADMSENEAQFATLGMGTINVLMTIVSLALVEKAGRKTLLLIGFAGMSIDTIVLAFALAYATHHHIVSYFAIALVLIFVIMFATGPGSIPWFLVSEMFSQSSRPAATSLAVVTNWTANFFVGLGFLPLQELIGPYIFLIFTACLITTVIFIWKKVPETKNKTIEEVTALFRQQSYE